jgi:hypothetical protein
MSTVVAVLVRLTVIALALGAYYLAIPALFPDSTDANIGAGLIAFAGLVLVSLGWAFADARARGAAPTLVTWAAVAIAFGVLWLLAMTVLDPDDGIGLFERLRLDASTAVFTAVLAGVGAAIGGTVHRPD